MQILHLAPFFDLEGGDWRTSKFGRDHAIEEEGALGRVSLCILRDHTQFENPT